MSIIGNAILLGGGGGSVAVESLSVTQNGTYTAPTGKAYSPVTVSVSGGGVTPAEPKDVNFIDYDGTILYSYTKAEFALLAALPANPSHTGLTAQGWNWSLSDAKTYVASYGKLWIGQMYVTSSGKTEIDIELNNPDLLSPYLKISVNGTVTVDWGDGSTADTITGTSLLISKYTNHNYATTGNYTISIGVTSGSFSFYSSYILTYKSGTDNASRRYNSAIVAIRLGNSSVIGDYAFSYCYALRSITIPNNTAIGASAFQNCYALYRLTIPSGATQIGGYTISYCQGLQNISLPSGISLGSNSVRNNERLQYLSMPSGITAIEGNLFFNDYNLQSVVIPAGVVSIGSSVFNNNYALYSVKFYPTTTPTVANSNAWSNVSNTCVIYIPYSALADYLGASNYPSSTTYMYIGFATYGSGVTLPTQDSTQAYNVVWYATEADAKAQTNAISQGNGNEVYCRYTAV